VAWTSPRQDDIRARAGPFGYLLDGPLSTQASCLAPPALLMPRPPPLPHGFGLSMRAPETLGAIHALVRSAGRVAEMYSNDEDEPAPLPDHHGWHEAHAKQELTGLDVRRAPARSFAIM
jgi:hypothetical protein